MFPETCDGVLKNSRGQTLESGAVTVSITRRTADFVAPFVPLMQLGSCAKFICTQSGLATHIVTGKVYLSSSRLLRLVEISCVLLPNAEQVISVGTELQAELSVPLLHGGLFRRRAPHIWRPCTVLSLSLLGVSVRCKRLPDDYTEALRLRLAAPVFAAQTELSLSLTGNGILFGRQARYDCRYEALTIQQAAEAAAFIRDTGIAALGATV